MARLTGTVRSLNETKAANFTATAFGCRDDDMELLGFCCEAACVAERVGRA
jgi:hypothetical protein